MSTQDEMLELVRAVERLLWANGPDVRHVVSAVGEKPFVKALDELDAAYHALPLQVRQLRGVA